MMNLYVSGSSRDICVEGLRRQEEKKQKMDPPMFPRLHINDAEKKGVGPRAPPRNKMALYEHLTTHSSNPVSISQHLQPNNNSSTMLVPFPFFNHDAFTNKKSFFPSICNSSRSTTTNLYETLHSYHSGCSGLNLNPTLTTLEQHPKEQTTYQTSNTKPTGECKTFRHHNCSNPQISSEKKLSNKDDEYQVPPTSARSPETPNCGNDKQNTHKAKIPSSIPCAYEEPITACQRQLKQSGATDLKLRQHLTEEDTKLFHPSIQARGRISEPVDHTCVCPNPKKRSLVDYITRFVDPNKHLHEDYSILKDNKALIDGSSTEPKSGARKRNRLEAIHECNEVIDFGQAGKVERNDEIRKLCMMESTVSLDISPDGVLGVMGQKQFWNTRSTIVHQQRVFAVQVFELHRLMKVQRLIAGSPELILEGSFYLGNPSKNLSITKLPYENVIEQPPPSILKPKIDYEIPKPSNDCAAESAITKIPLPSLRNDEDKFENSNTRTLPPASTTTDAKSDKKPYSGPTQPAPFAATEANLAPLCFHPPPGNQWLVPVRSLSEGLVYKPYTGACPPTAGLVGPVYGNCGPVPFTPTYAGFLSGTPLGPTYFAPYGVPLMNLFSRAESNGTDNQLYIREVNFTVPYQSSCNMLRHKSRESDLQGSTGSSPTERTRGDPLPLFPMKPAVQVPDQPAKSNCTDLNQLAKSHCTEKQIRVIKVVPHNPKSASESAARIFQSIQQERRVCD